MDASGGTMRPKQRQTTGSGDLLLGIGRSRSMWALARVKSGHRQYSLYSLFGVFSRSRAVSSFAACCSRAATSAIGHARLVERGGAGAEIMRTIETQRCLCAPLTECDFPSVARLYTNHQVRRFLGGVGGGAFSQDRFKALSSVAGTLIWAVKGSETGAFIGIIVLGRHHDGEDMQLSYQFLPESWGRGLASETVGAIVDFARDSLLLPRIVAETQAANVRSKALLERLGMRPVRLLTRFGEEQVIYERQFEPQARADEPATF